MHITLHIKTLYSLESDFECSRIPLSKKFTQYFMIEKNRVQSETILDWDVSFLVIGHA